MMFAKGNEPLDQRLTIFAANTPAGLSGLDTKVGIKS